MGAGKGTQAAALAQTAARVRRPGYQVQDVIHSVGGRKTDSQEDFRVIMSHAFPGETDEFEILRDGEILPLAVQFGAVGYTMDKLNKLRKIAGLKWCAAHDLNHQHDLDEGAPSTSTTTTQ